jgi:hypothetical protein
MPTFPRSRLQKISITGLTWGLLTLATPFLAAAQSNLDSRVDANLPGLLETYKHLHENPELSTQEKETAAFVAAELKT